MKRVDPGQHATWGFDQLVQGLSDAGVSVKHPVLLLTLLPLTMNPDGKLSDRGVVDVARGRVLPTLLPA